MDLHRFLIAQHETSAAAGCCSYGGLWQTAGSELVQLVNRSAMLVFAPDRPCY